MRKKLLFVLMLLLLVRPALAQPEFPTWGKLTPEEKSMKECPFDKEADAVVLLDEAVSDYNGEYNLVTWHHKRIKILKEKGIEWANVTIPFYARDGFEFIDDLEGMVYNVEGNGTVNTIALEKKSIYTEQSNQYWHRKKFTFPNIRAGSIIEYKYMSQMKHYGGLDDWRFHDELPVVKSHYVLSILPNSEFTYVVQKSDLLPIDVQPDQRNGKISFEMNNIPGLRDEPYMDARRDYLQRVTFQMSAHNANGFGRQKYMTSWDEVIRELLAMQSFGSQIGKNISGTDEFINTMKLLPERERIKRVFNYTRNYMEWNGMYGITAGDGLKGAWSKKTGTITEINMILLNLLLEAGLEAYPLLVSERQHGKVSTQYPFLDQFNAMYAVVVIEGRKYYLDATDQYMNADMIPLSILNTTGLIVHRKKGGLINITDDAFQYKENMTCNIRFEQGSMLKGTLLINSTDYARSARLRQWRRNKDRYLENLKGVGMVIDSFSVANDEVDSLPLREYAQFHQPVTANGTYLLVPVNMFSGFEKNPFLSETRFSDINFGYKQQVSFSTYIDIPEGYAPEELPKSLQLVNADKTVVCVREVFHDTNANKILARFRVELRKSHYGAEEYADLKEFYKKMFDLLGEQIVFKKK